MRNHFAMFAVTLSTLAFAACASADCSALRCDNVYIEQLYVDSGDLGGGDIWVRTSGAETALSCTANGGVLLKLSASSTYRKDVYALLMMAFSADKPVSIRVMPGTDCPIAYVTVDR
ncbi:hypothetical protein [Steroidobacter sp.]|uniref:hypothetical protein n=1 Tax=Steroidobacter sp. TaxID=1978227 RepID=UPI001A4BC61A|nr:hypothetical protein [Steroidobacter sp.]MBL8266023.1 hypothetical protein [Steroidobacter sp.]